MSYRCIRVKKADELRLRHNTLHAQIDEREVEIPLEDISIILIEDNQCMISAKLIASLSSFYIGLLICDDKYMPISLTLPLHMHYKQLKVFELQSNVKKPVLSQVWTNLIRWKIRNQISVLKATSDDNFYLPKLVETLKDIKSNDKTNRELSLQSTSSQVFMAKCL